MAEKIAEGAKSVTDNVQLYDIENMDLHQLHDIIVMSKGVIFGSPTINRTMVKPMWDAFSVIDPMANQGKVAGVFGSYGWSGEGITMAEANLKGMGFKMPVESLKKKFFPSDDTLQECFDFGAEFAKQAK
jgi:flavorubredoxin